MINRLSNRESGAGHPPAPPGASREQSETQQPTARPGRQTGRPGITTACSSVNPVALTSIQTPRPADQARIDTRSPAWHLPALVLSKIVGYLSPSDQCRCARVCRHWYDCLPAPRVRL
ncbi:MAG: F-box protein, partial [Kistimonas sp.]|nr:F-box protein [Kistimonas sp.]